MAWEFGTPDPDQQDDSGGDDNEDSTVGHDNPTISGRAMRQRIVQEHFTRQVSFGTLC